MAVKRVMPLRMVFDGPLAGVQNIWPENCREEIRLIDREAVKEAPGDPTRWHVYRRTGADRYSYVTTEVAG